MEELVTKEDKDYDRLKGSDVMSTMKPIQATPELSGKDARNLLQQTSIAPSKDAIRKNEMLRNILREIQK